MPQSTILGQTVSVYYGDLPENFDSSRPDFQGQSRSLEPTQINQLPMTSYWWSRVTTGLSCTISNINSGFCQNLPIFPNPRCLTPLWGSPLGVL